ncbi:MAG: glycerophosphodiester phosphodiesterase [Lachnospiraceae bacterium]|nr:glycerophosphodiester phosphodiesterase [Lachnospiraceae bacterium]
MKLSTKLKIGTMGALGAGLFLIAPGKRADKEAYAPFQNRNIAHRGLFEADQSIPENSLAAFARAVEAGYGIELDVQLSKDGKVVVFHDGDLKRICGVDQPVDALTLKQLKKLSLCGTEERIPLFKEVLELVDGRVPIIVELKAGGHDKLLCGKVRAILEEYDGEYCMESFDPRIVGWFKKHMPQVVRGQLSCPAESFKKGTSALQSFVLSHVMMNCVSRPQFIAYQIGPQPFTVRLAERLGAKKVCWTSHDPANEQLYDTVIFEHYRPKVWYNVNKKA